MKPWLFSLNTDSPQASYELEIKFALAAIKYTQADLDIGDQVRANYAGDANALIASSQLVATRFATIAEANRYWPDSPGDRS